MEALSYTQPKDMFRVVGTLLSKQIRFHPTSPTQSNYLTNLPIFSVKKYVGFEQAQMKLTVEPM